MDFCSTDFNNPNILMFLQYDDQKIEDVNNSTSFKSTEVI